MEKERTSPWLILFRVVFTAALIACIMFIFRNSLENGAQSSARSQAVMQLVNSALAKVHLGPLSEHLIRKLAHFSEFALEGFLLMLCIRVYTKHFVRHMSWPLLGGMTTALMDETIQLHSPNRTSSVVDVWIDMSGTAVCTHHPADRARRYRIHPRQAGKPRSARRERGVAPPRA